jgi:hypothetical protein
VILGDPGRGQPPLDPFMRESIAPRSGNNPIVASEQIAPPDAPFQANSINGHEHDAAFGLQHACIFPLPAELERDCRVVGSEGCDCPANANEPNQLNPLCQDASGYGSVQRYAKAFPGLRELDVAKQFGKNAIVASVCPKVIDQNQPDFGYAPAVDAVIERLKEGLTEACLPRPIDRNPDGTLPCRTVEVLFSGGPECANLPDGRVSTREADPPLDRAVRDELERAGRCASPGCSEVCLATLSELTGDARLACESGDDTGAVGYCYVDPEPPPIGSGIGDPELVDACPETAKRMLRLVGPDTPRRGSVVYIACAGRSFGGD